MEASRTKRNKSKTIRKSEANKNKTKKTQTTRSKQTHEEGKRRRVLAPPTLPPSLTPHPSPPSRNPKPKNPSLESALSQKSQFRGGKPASRKPVCQGVPGKREIQVTRASGTLLPSPPSLTPPAPSRNSYARILLPQCPHFIHLLHSLTHSLISLSLTHSTHSLHSLTPHLPLTLPPSTLPISALTPPPPD